MAYSRFLDNWNDEQEITNYPISNTFKFGKEIDDENKNDSEKRKKIMKHSNKK
jgi:hypothetical protein